MKDAAKGSTLVCGTNSLEPLCRTYRPNKEGNWEHERPHDGKHLLASSPGLNTTYTSVDGELYVALARESGGRLKDPFILKSAHGVDIRTTPEMYNDNLFNSTLSLVSVKQKTIKCHN